MSKDESLIFEIADDSIDVGYDTDGTPITVAKEKPKAEVVETKAKAPAAVVEEDEAPTAKVDTAADDRLAALTRERDDAARARAAAEAQIATERAARLKAEGESAEGRQVALRAHWAKVQSDAQAIEATLASTKSQMDAARAEFRAAKDAGDTERELKAHEILTQATHDYRELEQGKRGVQAEAERVRDAYKAMAEEAAKAPVVEPEKKQEPKQATPEDWIDGVRKSVGDKVADWLATNKQFVTDPKLNAKVISFSKYYADVEEKPLNDPEFIKALSEKFLPKPKATAAAAQQESDDVDQDDDVVVETVEKPKAAAPKSKVAASAPVNRSGSYFSSNNLSATKAKLPPYLANKARELGFEPAEYAQYIVKGIKEGKMPKNYLDPDYPHGQ